MPGARRASWAFLWDRFPAVVAAQVAHVDCPFAIELGVGRRAEQSSHTRSLAVLRSGLLYGMRAGSAKDACVRVGHVSVLLLRQGFGGQFGVPGKARLLRPLAHRRERSL